MGRLPCGLHLFRFLVYCICVEESQYVLRDFSLERSKVFVQGRCALSFELQKAVYLFDEIFWWPSAEVLPGRWP